MGEPVEYEVCGEGLPFSVTELDIEPLKPRPGRTVMGSFKGNFSGDAPVEAAEVKFVVELGSLEVGDGTLDLCELLDCPLAPGEIGASAEEKIPSIAPPGDYNVRIEALDKTPGNEDVVLACVELGLTVRPPDVVGGAKDFFGRIFG
ncbi:unnamed protein product [Ostreobium quekettii]|uniref:MD-2-related lipid-recognition domain-containing protein n=1 Tax=Ostreobium quekettii TaxID=121088 RepID=A0A8S1J0G7_9CHLO|nr:unnamed protein product [Ostreobium quekettii]|eukprot:evm.model.scf_71.6 EVM.evm.TU.scf_71.6   scf_71:84591-86760(+)